MAAPEYVPPRAIDDTRIYRSAPRRPGSWIAERPGELVDGQPWGDRFGNQGPDQGFALRLAERLRDSLVLRPGERSDDAVAGGVIVALKRSSLFGRAPTIHDLRIAFTIWGFLDDQADDGLVAERRLRFEEAANAHHYGQLQAIADAVPEATLRLALAEVESGHKADWRGLLEL